MTLHAELAAKGVLATVHLSGARPNYELIVQYQKVRDVHKYSCTRQAILRYYEEIDALRKKGFDTVRN
jgi:hypothetical protein